MIINLDSGNATNASLEFANHLRASPDIQVKNIEVRLAEQPDIINYYRSLVKAGMNSTHELDELITRSDIYMITHSIGIIDNDSVRKISQVGLRIRAEKTPHLQNRALIPETAFIKPKVGGGFVFDAGVNVNGELSLPQIGTDVANLPVKAKAGGDVKASLSSNLSINLSLPALAPVIQSIGRFSNYAEWCVNFHDKPLVGDQSFIQLVAVDKGSSIISLEVQVYVTVKTFGLVNSRRESNWIPIEIKCPVSEIASV